MHCTCMGAGKNRWNMSSNNAFILFLLVKRFFFPIAAFVITCEEMVNMYMSGKLVRFEE